MVPGKDWWMWLGVGSFGCGEIIGAFVLFPGANRLVLNIEGFEVRFLFRRWRALGPRFRSHAAQRKS
jgi:hypothetical protein